jgi:hypothetical protein
MLRWRIFGDVYIYITYYIGVVPSSASVLAGGCEDGTWTDATPGEVKLPGVPRVERPATDRRALSPENKAFGLG